MSRNKYIKLGLKGKQGHCCVYIVSSAMLKLRFYDKYKSVMVNSKCIAVFKD